VNFVALTAFLTTFDKLIGGLPVRPDDGVLNDSVIRYYRLEPINESPWIHITERKGRLVAEVCGDGVFHESPEATAAAFTVECRTRMEEANVEPAF
jgi:hypothetical protein